MRAVSLSNPEIISLLNRYYVPVYLSNEDYREGGKASMKEKAELRRIHQEAYAKKLSVGTVHAFVLDPDGHTLNSLHVAQAYKADPLSAMLKQAVDQLGTTPGTPVVRPEEQSHAPFDPQAFTLHLIARYLERKGDGYALVVSSGGDWNAFPAEDWVALSKPEWRKLLPPGKPTVGATWTIDREVSASLLTHFYPPTENNDVSKNRLIQQSLRGTVVSVGNGVVRARLGGNLKMAHSFYGKEDGRTIDTDLLGTMDFRANRSGILNLDLVTGDAVYHTSDGGGQPFGVAVQAYRGK
jgi:hypothetical protein